MLPSRLRHGALPIVPVLSLASLASLVALAVACGPEPAPVAPSPAPPPPASSAPVAQAPADEGPRPPVARRQPVVTQLHGQTRTDDYYWLRGKGTPEVERYLEAENAYTAAVMKPTEPLQQALYAEMLAHVKEDDATPPYREGAFEYYRRTEKGKQYPIYCRRHVAASRGPGAAAPPSPEVVLLDLNELGKAEKFIDVQGMAVSDDGNSLAYLVDTAGYRQYTLKIKDLRTGAVGPEAIPRVDEVQWARDGKTLFYVTEDAQTKRPDRLLRHVAGKDAAGDALVYEEKDEAFNLSLDRTRSKAFEIVTSASRTTSEVRVLDAGKPLAPPRVIAPREHDHEYYVDHRGDRFYITTNSGGRNFRVVTAPVDDPRRERWKELVAHRPDALIEDVLLFRDFMVLQLHKDALPEIDVVDLRSGQTHVVAQPEPIYETRPDVNREFDSATLRLRYQSPRTPVTYVDYDLRTRARTVLKVTEVPGFDPAAYETRRILAPARDGTPVPVSLVYRKGTQPDGTHPAYLYAYGSYGFSSSTTFSSDRLALLDRGFVYAVAHIRGGGDMGKAWHDQGRMMNKMNTFTDFIDVAELLKKQGWARKDGLVVAGGSAGGLLMGAVTNLRPDLFDVVLAYVPFVDVINTELDESLPETVNEWEEWGNPKKKPEYDYMMKYSPYDNVAPKAYPTMLVRTSYNDSQVMYWEPAKWVARLRATETSHKPLLFKVNMDPAGHGGQSGRYDRLRDTAFDYAFVLRELGMGG